MSIYTVPNPYSPVEEPSIFGTTFVVLLIFWMGTSIVAAMIASDKGRSGIGWFCLGLLCGPIALLAAVIAPRETAGAAHNGPVPAGGDVRKVPPAALRACPYCAEDIKPEAIKCRFCGSEVEPVAKRCDFCTQLVRSPAQPCADVGEERLRRTEPSEVSAVCRQELQKRGYMEGGSTAS
jgi:hypothetical protein